MNNFIFKLRTEIILTICLCVLVGCHPNLVKIKGVVIGQRDQIPIPEAKIKIKNEEIETELDGQFLFECLLGDSIEITAVGYEKTIIPIFREDSAMLIQLKGVELDSVVVKW